MKGGWIGGLEMGGWQRFMGVETPVGAMDALHTSVSQASRVERMMRVRRR